MNRLASAFSTVAHWTARQMGQGSTFALAVFLVIAWGLTGPIFHYSDTWQLVINTGTTIVTFLMVFLLQHAQNRDSTAIQLKLDELIRVNRDARNKLLTLEDLTEAEMQHMKDAFKTIGNRAPLAAELVEVEEDLREAKDGIEQAQTAIIRATEAAR